jgi:hypothetical protein
MMPVEILEMRCFLTLSLAKMRMNAETISELMTSLFMETHITLHYITNSFCQNVLKIGYWNLKDESLDCICGELALEEAKDLS